MQSLHASRHARASLKFYDRALLFLLASLVVETAMLVELFCKAVRMK